MRGRHWLILLISLLTISCGGSGGAQNPGLDSAYANWEAELDALDCPAGCDGELWQSLKSEFRSVMAKAAQGKLAALVPDTDASTIVDLHVSSIVDDTATIAWSYLNEGDYNQDSLVSVNDLTEIGRYFGLTSEDPGWDKAMIADGNQDGVVNVSDITPIGMYYERRVEGYLIYYRVPAGTEAGEGELDTVTFADVAQPIETGRRQLSYTINGPTDGVAYWVRPFDGDDLGNRSNDAIFFWDTPVVTVNVPVAMEGRQTAEWGVTWERGTAPFIVTWDFGGGASNLVQHDVTTMSATTSAEMINESKSQDASYTCAIMVTDADGHSGVGRAEYTIGPRTTFDVEVTVPQAMQGQLVAGWRLDCLDAESPCAVTWDFGGGAENPEPTACNGTYYLDALMVNASTTEDAPYTYTISVVDDLGLTGSASGTYTVGPTQPLPVTVTVPENMRGDCASQWLISWPATATPVQMVMTFGGGGEDLDVETNHSYYEPIQKMVNESRTDSAQYSYHVTVTNALGNSGEASGDYTVGPNPCPLATVTVPENMFGNADAQWRVDWAYGEPPYTVEWRFGGGATNPEEVEATSPATHTALMFNPSMTQDATYTYTVIVSDSLNRTDVVSDEYTVGPGPNLPPVINWSAFNFGERTLIVNASDLNTDEELTIEVTEPAGFHADTTSQFFNDNDAQAVFAWTIDEPAAGRTGTAQVTVTDKYGLTAEIGTFMAGLEPDTLYAIPLATAAVVDEPVRIVVTTGQLPNPFQYLCMAGLTVEQGAALVTESINVGAVGGAMRTPDGLWAEMDPSSLTGTDGWGIHVGGDARHRWEFYLLPTAGVDLVDAAGDLFNFEFTFSEAGTYILGFEQVTGTVKRTYYEDWDEYEYYWGDISNNHAGFPNSIVVTE
ncbi:hypothetical protein JW859_08845 [bacterium]|nr:hypothetical protein [bacterium]